MVLILAQSRAQAEQWSRLHNINQRNYRYVQNYSHVLGHRGKNNAVIYLPNHWDNPSITHDIRLYLKQVVADGATVFNVKEDVISLEVQKWLKQTTRGKSS